MKKYYLSFGQVHRHTFGKIVFDKDCLCEISADSEEEVRTRAIRTFGLKWHRVYADKPDISYFPRGVIKLGRAVLKQKVDDPKRDFLKRCETIYDMGLADQDNFKHIEKIFDGLMRLVGHQPEYFYKMLESEYKRTDAFSNRYLLANDKLGMNCINLLAVLTHPCQKCAEDKDAWHTRAAFCDHKNV